MPIFPGEERLVTLFADCHYYFAQPTARPVLHRFDKASYFYIYWNATRQTSRIEIANNPGTPDQDAFNGYLDTCRIINSDKFPARITLIVDATDHAPSPTTRANRDPDEWRLASADPRDTHQMKHRLHTIDLYFYTQEDAQLVTEFLKKMLDPAQLNTAEPKPAQQQQQQQQQVQQQKQQPPDATVSPVVQNLENVAISDPAYRNGQTRNSQNQPQYGSNAIKLPPPPPPSSQPRAESRTTRSPPAASPSPVSPASNVGSQKSSHAEKPRVDYTPMAYNPAAPAAPEKIAHREKTPPPEDGADGTGLSAATMHDHVTTSGYKPSQSWGGPPTASTVTQSSHWGSPPPLSTTTGYGSPAPSSVGYASPPPPPGNQYQPGRSSVVSEYQPGRSSAAPEHQPGRPSVMSGASSFAPPPTSVQVFDPHRHSMAAETYTPEYLPSPPQAVETPGTQFLNTIQPPQKPLQHVQPHYADYLSAGSSASSQSQPPNYAAYAHNQSQHSHSGQGNDYDVHNQVYRPTEAESAGHSKPSKSRNDSLLNSKTGKKAKSLISKYL